MSDDMGDRTADMDDDATYGDESQEQSPALDDDSEVKDETDDAAPSGGWDQWGKIAQ